MHDPEHYMDERGEFDPVHDGQDKPSPSEYSEVCKRCGTEHVQANCPRCGLSIWGHIG